MEREDIIVLDGGMDMESMETAPVCCETDSASVR